MFLLIGGSGLSAAEVKLRIYLNDGSLQSGSLVAETEQTFVILAKSGREEIAKKNIMFINGKTLAQWQERPDKFFQTEILPSEIPNPAYVNDKAALPQPPKIVPKIDAPVPPRLVKPAVVESPAIVKPVEKPVIAEEQKKPLVVEAPVIEKKRPQPKPRPTPVPVVSSAAKPAAHAAPPKKSEPRMVLKGEAAREVMAEVHYQRALTALSEGRRGYALQELAYSTVLNRRNAEAFFLLGQLYAQEGLRARAEKALGHPSLRKRAEVQELLAGLQKSADAATRQKWILRISAGAGLLLPFPLIALLRTRKRKSGQVVISAEELEPVVDSPATEFNVPDVKPAAHEAAALEAAQAVSSEVASLSEAIAQAEQLKATIEAEPPVPQPTPEEAPEPIVFKIFPMPEAEGSVQPVIEAPPAPQPAPVTAEPIVPPAIPARSTPHLFEMPSRAPELVSQDEQLKTARQVAELIQKGHGSAAKGETEIARKEYHTAAALDPTCVDAQLGLAYLSFMQSAWDLALAHYMEALAINPASADAHYGIGRVLLENGHEEEAIMELKKALELDPTLFEARDTLTALGQAA